MGNGVKNEKGGDVKKAARVFVRHPILIVAIFIIAFYLPAGLSAPPEGLEFIHATSIGVDKNDDGVELSILAFVISPSENYNESFHFLSAKAENLADALNLIGENVGKRVVLAHAGVIVLGEELARNGVIEELNYFFRSHTIPNDTYLITSNVPASEFLKAEQKLISEAGVRVEEIGIYNDKFHFFNDINLEAFYKGYFSSSKASMTGYVQLVNEEDALQQSGQGVEGGSGSFGPPADSAQESGGQGGQGGQEGGKNKKFVQNLIQIAVFYDGVMQDFLSREETMGLNWISRNLDNTEITLKNISDENFDNADLVFMIENNFVQRNAYFVDGKPVLEISITLTADIQEVLRVLSDIKPKIASSKSYLTKTVSNEIEAQVKREFSSGLRKLFQEKADVIEALSTLEYNDFNKTKKWLSSLSESQKENYLSLIDYRLSVKVRTGR